MRPTRLDLGAGPVRPPCAWSVRGINGPIRARVDLTVEVLSESRSRLSITVDCDGHGIGRVLVPLVVRRHLPKCLRTSPGSRNKWRLARSAERTRRLGP